MNWSHALLVVALAAGFVFITSLVATGEIAENGEDATGTAKIMLGSLIIATISGALAAGLWR